ncbi:hypothetical protein LCGC14_0267850 [marine sediment metagenome]|uniref:Uncharacterized protein n=1 Tax=marine sediment metagenome TaxID=412755 RepID=A0A0F9U4Q9_9ZZZZ
MTEKGFLPATWNEISAHYGSFLDKEFASAHWKIADILQYVANVVQHLPTKGELVEFSDMAASQLEDDMVSRGWDSISTLVDIWHGDRYCKMCNSRLKEKSDVENNFQRKCERCQKLNWFTMSKDQRRYVFTLIQKHLQWVADEIIAYKIRPGEDFETKFPQDLTNVEVSAYPQWFSGTREESLNSNEVYIRCGHTACNNRLITSDPWEKNAYNNCLDHIFEYEHEKVADHPMIFGNT